jgi:hypothetical protein
VKVWRFCYKVESHVTVSSAFLIPSVPVQTVELLRDRHGSEEYVFEANQSEITATVDAAGATVIASNWATHFYGDLLSVENCQFRHRPIRFRLISFARSSGDEELYAIVLPNGTVLPARITMTKV